MLSLRIALSTFALSVVLLHSQASYAQPTRAVVPFPAGGPLDVVARLITQKINDTSKSQTFVVENRPGANGQIAAKAVAQGDVTGKTWLFAESALFTVNPFLYRQDPAFDPERDLKVVASIGFQPAILVVNPTFAPKTLAEFVDFARKNEIPFASGGVGSAGHLTMEYFGTVAGLKLRHVPYRGGAPAMNDLVGGQVPAAFVSIPGALPFVTSHQLRALAVSGTERAAGAPDVPTVKESCFPEFDVRTAYFVLLPSKTPEDVASSVRDQIKAALADNAVRDRLQALGIQVAELTQEEASKWLSTERAKWSKLISEKAIQATE